MSMVSENSPYPALYGHRQRYFNIGVSFHPPPLATSLTPVQAAKQTDQAYLKKEI